VPRAVKESGGRHAGGIVAKDALEREQEYALAVAPRAVQEVDGLLRACLSNLCKVSD
jgi:hypothetical protein